MALTVSRVADVYSVLSYPCDTAALAPIFLVGMIGYGLTAFRNRWESETQPSSTSVARSEASWLLRGNPCPIGSLMQSASRTHK